jgi:hypothetical protein
MDAIYQKRQAPRSRIQLATFGARTFCARSTGVDTDVAGIDGELGVVLAADMLAEGNGARRRHDVVLLGEDVEDRHRQLLQVHLATTDLQRSLDELVAFQEVADEFLEGLADGVGTTEQPLFHAQEVLQRQPGHPGCRSRRRTCHSSG